MIKFQSTLPAKLPNKFPLYIGSFAYYSLLATSDWLSRWCHPGNMMLTASCISPM